MSTPVRWLVVGAGQAGQCHMAAIAKTPAAVLAGVVDPAAAPGIAGPVFRDLGDGIAKTKPDAVIIAAPNDLHRALARQAIDAGLPVLCEKPVGRTVTDAEDICAYAEARGVPAGVVLNQRTHASSRWVHDQIASGRIAARSVSFAGAVPRLGRWHIETARSGGGALRTIAIHALDLMLWWLGEPTEISAQLGGGVAEDVVSVTGRFKHGRIGVVNISAVADIGAGPVRCVIDDEHTRVVMDGHRVIDHRGLPPPPAAEAHDPALKYGPGHLNLIADATAGFASGRGFLIPLTDALPTLRLIERLYVSSGRITGDRTTGR